MAFFREAFFYFGDNVQVREKAAAFSPSVLELTKPEMRNI